MTISLFRLFLMSFIPFFMVGFTLDIFADETEIASQSFSFDNVSIIEFSNNSLEEIKTIKIWLDDSSFISFKTENDWISPTASPDTIFFTTTEPIKPNEIVKFGIKTENSNPFIRWEVFDKDDNSIEVGKTQSENLQSFLSRQETLKKPAGILSESTFKVVPKNPHPGSTVRIFGDNFVPASSLELFLSETKLKSFETDENGNFMLTIKIPQQTNAEMVNFILKDKQENEKIVSLYLTEIEQKIPKNIELTVSKTQNEFFRADGIELSGTANPESLITIKIKNPQGNLFSTKTTNVDSQGHWSTLIPLTPNAPIGKYSIEINGKKNTIVETFDVVMSKKIHVIPSKLKFSSEELIKFNATANHNERINLVLLDPQGNNVLSSNFIVPPSGFFEIEYPTLSSSIAGTYALYAFQGHEVEIAFAGLNQYPKKIFSAKLNDVNYSNEDVAIIGMTGKPSQTLKLSVIDQNGNEQLNDSIQFGLDGKRSYPLSLTKVPPGIYTLVASMENSHISEVFSVGLPYSSKVINLDMAKTNYNPGQSLQVIGVSQPNTIVDLFLIDPDGIVISKKESFVNNYGNLVMNDFIIPYDSTFGKWVIRAEGSSNFANFEFQVTPSEKEELYVHVTDILSSSIGKFVTIEGFVNIAQSVEIVIEDPLGKDIFQTEMRTTESGEFNLLWQAPSESISGTYSVTVKDMSEKIASDTFDL